MGTRNLVARVRELLERAQAGTLGAAELAAAGPLLDELHARVARLRALGAEIELGPDVAALEALRSPVTAAA